MHYIVGNKFKVKGIEYVVTKIVWKSIMKGEVDYYEFKTTNWDNEIKFYKMSGKEFKSKIGIDNYVSLS